MINKKRSLLYLASVALFGVAVVSDALARLSLPTLTEEQKKDLTLKFVEAGEAHLKNPKDLQKAEDFGKALASSVGVTPAAAEKLALETAKSIGGGPAEIFAAVGIQKIKAWKDTHGTSVERVINYTPYYFVAFTRDINASDPNIKQVSQGYRYDPVAAIEHEGSVIIAPGETITFPPHIFRSQDKKEYVLMLVGYGEEANTEEQLAFEQGRLPVGVAVVDTGKKGEGLCNVTIGQRVLIKTQLITGPNPNDKRDIDCSWLCGRRKAKRIELILGKWGALKGSPDGRWDKPSTIATYRVVVRQMNDSRWKARYNAKAPTHGTSKVQC